jgi:hypothetical protein
MMLELWYLGRGLTHDAVGNNVPLTCNPPRVLPRRLQTQCGGPCCMYEGVSTDVIIFALFDAKGSEYLVCKLRLMTSW